MPIYHRKIGKRRLLLIAAEREGLAVARARWWLSRIKSKSQVKRRGRGWKYRLTRSDRQLHATLGTIYVTHYKIAPYESWQFPADSQEARDMLGQLSQIGVDITIDRSTIPVSKPRGAIDPKSASIASQIWDNLLFPPQPKIKKAPKWHNLF